MAPPIPRSASPLRRARTLGPALALCALGGALAAAPPPPPSPTAPAPSAVDRGRALAEARCAPCHAVHPNGSSPNPESPPFDDIANRPGLTAESFAAFLADAHNYPAAMDFTVQPPAVADLAAYMASLRRPGYRPSR